MDLAGRAGQHLEQASPDLLRAMLKTFAEALMSAEADAVCGAPYGQSCEEGANHRDGYGYRERRWKYPGRHDGAGDPEAAGRQLLPGLAAGAAASEQALISVVAISYLLGVPTRR